MDLVLNCVNASLARPIDADTLAASLAGIAPREPWLAHLAAFFTETPLNAIEDFASARGVSPDALRDAYRTVTCTLGESSHDVEAWLESLVGSAP